MLYDPSQSGRPETLVGGDCVVGWSLVRDLRGQASSPGCLFKGPVAPHVVSQQASEQEIRKQEAQQT